MENSKEIQLPNCITESWFDCRSDAVVKKGVPESYEIATEDGEMPTLESTSQQYKKGWYIMTGPKGDRYPISPDIFNALKVDKGNGIAVPRPIVKRAKLADHDGSVKTSWGEILNYTSNNDYIVRHDVNDYGVVKKDIFERTYEEYRL